MGQLIVATFPARADKQTRKQIKALVKKYKIGGLLFSEGVAEEQAILTNIAQKESDVPVLITFDGEWGLSMEEEDINRRCRKVLTYKYVLGLRKRPQIHLSGLGSRVNTSHTKDLIRRLNLAAVTVLGNQQGILPLSTDIKQLAVLNVGDNKIIKPFFKELSEYTHPVGFQLGKSLSEAERINLKETLSHYKRIIVCVTDHRLAPYQTFFADFAPKVPVVYVFFIPGKQILQIHRGVSAADAVVLAHSPGEDIQKHDVALYRLSAISKKK